MTRHSSQQGPARVEPAELEIIVDEKHPPQPPGTKPPRETPILYLYLTLNRDLPLPPAQREAGLSQDLPLPPCPNLKPYVSPLLWSAPRKAVVLALSCIATFLTAYTAGSYSPPSHAMAEDLHTTHLLVLVGITTFCLGFAFAPMALAPISEIWGRYPVFVVAGIVYVIFQAVCSVATDLAGILIARFLVGVGASVFSSVVGGVIADVWEKEDRNTPMALFSGFVLSGTAAGPLVSAAFVTALEDQTRAWKWCFWVQVIGDGLLMVALIFLLKESRASVLLSQKAKVLNKWYEELENAGAYGVWISEEDEETDPAIDSSGSRFQPDTIDVKYISDRDQGNQRRLRRIRWVVQADEERPPLFRMISTSCLRPFHLLLTEPVVFWFSLWAAFSWGVLYLSFAAVPFLYSDNLKMSARIYSAMMASAVVATAVGILQEHLMKHPQWQGKDTEGVVVRSRTGFWAFMRRNFPAGSPEARLYFSCLTALFLPAGLFGAFLGPSSAGGYAQPIGIGFATWGIYSVYLATFNYLADTYHIYASSALAAQSCCRNTLGGAFPLLTGVMFTNLGLKGAGYLLGGIATALTVVPWVLVFFGEKIRGRSKFAVSLQQ